MRTLSSIAEAICIEIGESITNAEIMKNLKRFINRSYKELAKIEGLEKTITVTVEDYFIEKPSDYIKTVKTEHDGNIIPNEEIEDKIFVQSNGEILLTYNYEPIDLIDTDTPLTNPSNDEFIYEYTKHLYYMSENQVNRADYHRNNALSVTIKKPKKAYSFKVER